MRSDAPIATALSGGLDSSTIYATIRSLRQNNSEKRVAPGSRSRCFTMTFPECAEDETQYANEVSRRYGEVCHEASIQICSLPEQLERTTLHYGDFSPNPIVSLVPLYKLISSQRIKVSIDGHGGDECLLGYPDMMVSIGRLVGDQQKEEIQKTLIQMVHNPNYVEPSDRIPMQARLKIELGKLRSFFRPTNPTDTKIANPPQSLTKDDFEVPELVRVYRNEVREMKSSVFGVHRASFELEKLPLILRNFDKASMMSGIEIRAPFLDFRLVNFCTNLPLPQKVSNGYSKFLLRKTLSQRLPDSIVWRKNKIGINAPLAKWFSNSNVRNFCSEIIEGNAVKILNLSNSSNNNDRLFPKLEHNPDLCWFFINYSILMQN